MSSPKTWNSPCAFAHTHTYMCSHTQVQDSLPGTRQQCTAKWDVWEPPAAKRRTGRRNKPSLMETWHARRGGNSNKRLMGHGAFSTAAKYPPLLPPSLYSFAPVLSHVGRGGSTFQDLGPYPEVTYFCHPLIPILLRSLNWTKWTTQHQYVNHLRRSSCTKGEWTDLLIYCHKSVFYSHHGQISNLSTCELGCKAISWRRRWRSFVAI